MVRHHQGKYAAKHTIDIKPDARIAEAITNQLQDGKLWCASACNISDELDISLEVVGRNADLIEARITKCLLGFFGHRDAEGNKIKPEPAESVPSAVQEAINARIENGRLGCAALWEIGRETNTSKKNLGRICQTLDIKIVRCQLGAF